jgi:hypothetical protein
MANELNNSESVTETASVMKSAFCGSLRSKKFFMIAAMPTEAEEYLDGSNHCGVARRNRPSARMAGLCSRSTASLPVPATVQRLTPDVVNCV